MNRMGGVIRSTQQVSRTTKFTTSMGIILCLWCSTAKTTSSRRTRPGRTLMQDTHVVGINAMHSVVWDTECTPDYGDRGCDNHVGEFEVISRRVDQLGDRLRALGWEKTKAIWAVSQAFGGSSYRGGMSGPEFAGRHPWQTVFVLFPPPMYP